MKKILQSAVINTLVSCVVFVAGIGFAETAIARSAVLEAIAAPTVNSAPKQTKRCTPDTCTPYRANYERAIANRIITRPSGVNDVDAAMTLADRAIAKEDKNEAARRLAQALVILSETQGTDSALAFERALEIDTKAKRGQPLRIFLPLFERIFPTNLDPYR